MNSAARIHPIEGWVWTRDEHRTRRGTDLARSVCYFAWVVYTSVRYSLRRRRVGGGVVRLGKIIVNELLDERRLS